MQRLGIAGATFGGALGGAGGAEMNAQITRNEHASSGELIFGAIAGSIGGAISSGIRGDNCFSNTTIGINEFNRNMTTGVAPVQNIEWNGGRLTPKK